MESILEKIYLNHHKKIRKEGFVLLGEERAAFIKKQIKDSSTILDVGCRDGALASLYKNKDQKITGLDIDAEALSRAKKHLTTTIQADLNGDWPIPENHFDAVVAAEVVEHLYYPETVFTKISAALLPGGIFVGTVPNAFSLKNRLRYLFGRKKNTPLEDPTHINHFHYKELLSLLSNQFTDIKIVGAGKYRFLTKICPQFFAFDLMWLAKKK